MQEEKLIFFKNRLTKVFRHLSKQASKQSITCYRVYDHDLPEFPFCIEVYEDKVYMAEYKRNHGLTEHEHNVWLEESMRVVSDVLGISMGDIFLKLRQRKPGRLGQYQRIEDRQHEKIVKENGLKFLVNLSDYLDTGLFLDHRITRKMVKDLVEKKQAAGEAAARVLNLFSYTGSFSVYAAAGGANEVVTVDLSNTYLETAKRNFEINNLTSPAYQFKREDVLQYLKTEKQNHYDIIVLDPPTFSNSKKMEGVLDIQRDHLRLINDCLYLLKKGGVLFFSTNYRNFQMDAEKITASSIKDITRATTPFDFEKRLFRFCYKIEK